MWGRQGSGLGRGRGLAAARAVMDRQRSAALRSAVLFQRRRSSPRNCGAGHELGRGSPSPGFPPPQLQLLNHLRPEGRQGGRASWVCQGFPAW